MSAIDLAKLIFLASIWGGSFIFLRVAVPEVGTLLSATLRVGLASVVLIGFACATGVTMDWRRNLKPYALVGLFAAALPFTCFSFASLYLPAACCAVLNSTAPLFVVVLSVIWLGERLTARKVAGMILGIAGVAVLVGAGTVAIDAHVVMAAAAALIGSASYAVSTIIVKKTGRTADGAISIDPIAMATGSVVLGALIMAPSVPFSLPSTMPSAMALACLAGLSVLSSGIAQALFIPLIVRIGPTRAMSVSFLIPLFSMLWGAVFLHEAVGLATMIGATSVIGAMALVLSASQPKPEDALAVET